MSVIGLDIGRARIGLAVADGLGLTAQPAGMVSGRDFPALVARLQQLGAHHLVVGLPRLLSGEEGEQAAATRAYADRICDALGGVPVDYIDERLTSAAAHRVLHEAGLKSRDHKGKVDTMAACLILQSWLDGQKYRTQEKGTP